MKTNLKPCPFCGNSPEQTQVYVINDVKIIRYEIYCACCCSISFKSYDKSELIKKWNTRHDEMTLKKVLLLIQELAIKILALAILAAGVYSIFA